MGKLPAEFFRSPVFAGVPRAALDATEPLWAITHLDAGGTFCQQGDPGDSLALLATGECSVTVSGVVVNRILPGEMLGEVSAFFVGDLRSATLIAEVPSSFYTLSNHRLSRLRAGESPVYAALLKRACQELGRRVLRANDRLSRLVEGSHARPVRKDPSALARLWRALKPGGPAHPCPPIHPLLRALPRLRSTDPGTVMHLSVAFQPVSFAQGEILFLEQDRADSAWLLADGIVDVLRQVRGARAERLTQLKPGDLFGINALVAGGSRTASCVAASAGWAYRLDATASEGLKGPAAIWWQESILSMLQAQLRLATATLVRAIAGPEEAAPVAPPPIDGASDSASSEDAALQDLLRQSGFLEGLPAGIDLGDLEFGVPDDPPA
ncbi:MAG: cyclic nucleotide-binding domain-containing protein [Myxococcales bacterium]|nr:cyclic nucleotide-binding domain-containing protein [Myxococcales bacterium]